MGLVALNCLLAPIIILNAPLHKTFHHALALDIILGTCYSIIGAITFVGHFFEAQSTADGWRFVESTSLETDRALMLEVVAMIVPVVFLWDELVLVWKFRMLY